MTINYTLGIPAPNNSPSVDQPVMTDNSTSLFNIWVIDHYGFNDSSSTPAGQHQFVTFPITTSPTPPTGLQSVVYSADGIADSTKAVLVFKNGNNLVPMIVNTLRAFALFNGTSGSIVNGQSLNVMSIVRNSAGTYTITLSPNVVATMDYMVSANTLSISGGFNGIANVNIIKDSTTVFRVFTNAWVNPNSGSGYGPSDFQQVCVYIYQA